MELRQVRYFVAVAEEQNFGSAATILHISQPAVTRQIRKLEEELGVQLFVRTPRGAQLTQGGAAFLSDAYELLAIATRSVERSRAANRGDLGKLEVGFYGSSIYHTVPKVLREFRRRRPGVEVSLRRLTRSQQIDALNSGQLHIGFGRYYQAEPGIAMESLSPEGFMLAVAVEKADQFSQDDFTVQDLHNQPLILFPALDRPNFADHVLQLLNEHNVSPRVVAVSQDVRTALVETSIGVGATVVPESVALIGWPGVRFIAMPQLPVACPQTCIFKRSDTSPLTRAIVSTIRGYEES